MLTTGVSCVLGAAVYLDSSPLKPFWPYEHVLVHLAKLFQNRRFLEIDQSETRIACDSHI
jgi:hypothetical protein